MRCALGQQVGYAIRFEEVTSAQTQIKFLTDGMLLREALSDPLLSKYSVVMVDEAHERSLNSDVLLCLLKTIREKRSDLRIIVSSATIEAESVADFFRTDDGQDSISIISLDGRAHPVDIEFSQTPVDDYIAATTKTVIQIHKEEAAGDVLVFLTGRDDIDRCLQLLSDYSRTILPTAHALQPLPLFAGLSQAEQMYVFSPAAENTRKVILSTNIAEASVTIDGILYVVDCGYAKIRTYNASTNIEMLSREPISQASAIQRAGRAGRTRAGKCYRLYTQQVYQRLRQTTPPEIQRTNLAPLVLQLKALGIGNIVKFPFLSPPPAKLLSRSLETLFTLGALDDNAQLTSPDGVRMAELALSPMMAKALLSAASATFDCLPEMLTIAAMTSLQSTGNMNIWFGDSASDKTVNLARRKFAVEEGDHLTFLNVYQAFVTTGRRDQRWCQQHHLSYKALTKAVSIRNQLQRHMERFGIVVDDRVSNSEAALAQQKSTRIVKCLTAGFFMQAARMNPLDGTYQPITSLGRNQLTMYAHPTSLMFNRKADYIVFNELLETSDKIYIKDISKIEKSWLTELGNGYYRIGQSA